MNYAPRTAIGGVNGSSYRTPVSNGYRSAGSINDELRSGNRSGTANTPIRNAPSGARQPERTNSRVPDKNTAAEIRTPGRNNESMVAPDRNVRESTLDRTRNERNPRSDFFGNSNDRVPETTVPSRNNRFNSNDRLNDRVVETPAPTRNDNPRGGWFNNNDRAAEVPPVRESNRPRGGFFGNSNDRQPAQQAPLRNNDNWQNQRAVPERTYSAPPPVERRQMPRFEQRSMEAPRSQPRFEAPAQRMSTPSNGGFSAPSGGRGGGGFSAPSGGRGGGGLRR